MKGGGIFVFIHKSIKLGSGDYSSKVEAI